MLTLACLLDNLSSLEPPAPPRLKHTLSSPSLRIVSILFSIPRSFGLLTQDSCKYCGSRFQGEGVTLKFLSCLNRLSSFREQLSCLESVFRLLGKRTSHHREYSAVCIVHHTRNILNSVFAVCSLL